MPTKAYLSIMRGLKEAETFLQGKNTGAIVHHIEVPDPKPAPATPPKPANRPKTP